MKLSTDIPVENRLAIVQARIAQYKEMLFGLECDAAVARITQDEALKLAVQERMKSTVGGLKVFTDILEELVKEKEGA